MASWVLTEPEDLGDTVPRIPILVATAALTLGLAACGSSSSSSGAAASAGGYGAGAASSSTSSAAPAASSSSAAAAAPASTAGTVAISTDPGGALKFNTTAVSAKAGTVHISFTNQASIGHNLTIVKGTNGAQVAATPTFSGGAKSLSVKLAPGTYTYFCSIPGHRMAGMQGTLTVH